MCGGMGDSLNWRGVGINWQSFGNVHAKIKMIFLLKQMHGYVV